MFFCWDSQNNNIFVTKNGHERRAIWSNRDEALSSDIAMMRSMFWEGCHGAWALGLWENVKKCDIVGPFRFEFFFHFSKKNMKSVKVARVELISMQIESPHRV